MCYFSVHAKIFGLHITNFQAYMGLNAIDKAAESFKKAFELDPSDGE